MRRAVTELLEVNWMMRYSAAELDGERIDRPSRLSEIRLRQSRPKNSF